MPNYWIPDSGTKSNKIYRNYDEGYSPNLAEGVPVVAKGVLFPFVLITSLFALWGFANAVTDPMVQAFKKVLELSNSKATSGTNRLL